MTCFVFCFFLTITCAALFGRNTLSSFKEKSICYAASLCVGIGCSSHSPPALLTENVAVKLIYC